MQMEFSKLKPALFELQGQLDEQKRLNQQLEHELMETKNKQLEMLNAEVERFNKFVRIFHVRRLCHTLVADA